MERTIARRIPETVGQRLWLNQAGFRTKRSTTETLMMVVAAALPRGHPKDREAAVFVDGTLATGFICYGCAINALR